MARPRSIINDAVVANNLEVILGIFINYIIFNEMILLLKSTIRFLIKKD